MYSIKLLRLAHASSSCRNSYHSLLPTDSKKRRTWISYSLLVFPAASFALGYWQIQRRKWKIDLLEKINSRIPAKPIQLPHKTSILVNRGWVPYGARDPIIRPDGQVEGVVELSGYIRYQEKPPTRIFGSQIGSLTCLDHANQNPHIRYPCRQIDKMSNDLKTLPIFLDADYESSVVGGPVGGQTRVVLRNEHASYIFTWFSLGTIGLGMWIYFFIF
ncbi:Surfeit locus protein isoform 3 [Schistosoma japonicum]|uniref:SURF1-like protein n=1 Tax=Schistosoma japonicum TaxID=6182 RepID=Q5DDD5_SCHJA|nr:SJCHGC01620 protein [Schistosoma japonicum]TNN12707.1 Surfeit locus protein isoform 3 [Schistosoma japonicum]